MVLALSSASVVVGVMRRRRTSPLIRRDPLQQARPVGAAMHGAESSHSPQLLVLELHSQVGVAHETLPQQVDAVANVSQRMLRQRPLLHGGTPLFRVILFSLSLLMAFHFRVGYDLIVEYVESVPQLILFFVVATSAEMSVTLLIIVLSLARGPGGREVSVQLFTYQTVQLMKDRKGRALRRQFWMYKEATVLRE